MAEDVNFETIKSEEIKFGNNNFLEIARKKAVPKEGEGTEFISISRGFFTPENEKRFKKSIAFPTDEALVKSLVDALKKV